MGFTSLLGVRIVFEGFTHDRVVANGVGINLRHRGSAPPLAEWYTVVVPDMRGYGEVDPCLVIAALTGCASRARSSTGSRVSLSPKALATFNSVARVGLPSSDNAS